MKSYRHLTDAAANLMFSLTLENVFTFIIYKEDLRILYRMKVYYNMIIYLCKAVINFLYMIGDIINDKKNM